MSIQSLLTQLSKHGIKISAREGQLHIRAPKGSLTPELRHLLADHKTELIRRLEGLQRESGSARMTDVPLVPAPRDTPLPLSFAQQRLWFLDRLEDGSATYNMPSAFRLQGDLEITCFELSLLTIVTRHEVLRTTFRQEAGEPVQVVCPKPSLEIPVVDLLGLGPGIEPTVHALAGLDAVQPFNLAKGPVIRCSLLRAGAKDHVALFNMHHIVSDGWSNGRLIHEFAVIYGAQVRGWSPELPELPIQYGDFAYWQRRWLQGAELERQLTYWRERLAGLPPLLTLPGDRPRPAVQTYRGATEKFLLPQSVSRALEDLSRREGVSLFMNMLAGFQILLARYSRQADVAVGAPIANRVRKELENLIGFFVNTLVLRSRVRENLRYLEFLDTVRTATLADFSHQDIPFEYLLEKLQVARSLSHMPLIQVLLQVRNAPPGELDMPSVGLRQLKQDRASAKFDIGLHLTETEEGIWGVAEYATDLFERTTIQRLLRHYRTLLISISSHPERRLAGLSMLPADERRQLLEVWNQTGQALPSEESLHAFFERRAAVSPSAVALVRDECCLTYGMLNGLANALAWRLKGLGVGPEARVGICLSRGPELLTALYAVLKAGGAYVPLDPEYPSERIGLISSDASLLAILTNSASISRLPSTGPALLCLDKTDPMAGKTKEPARVDSSSGRLAYLIYTSGTTGTPKGVAIAHRNVIALLGWARRQFSAKELTGTLASTSICFDISIFELFLPPLSGGSVIMATNILALPTMASRARITLINTVPSAMESLIRERAVPETVAVVNLAGEPLSGALVRRIYERTRARRVYNLYGPSEDTTYTTWAEIPRGCQVKPTIGKPIDNTRIYIVDSGLGPVPIGVPGELLTAGTGLARGYHRRPALSAMRFVPNPFGQEPGSRCYRSGDLARFLADGTIDFLGRIDQQLKLRGFRIEPAEIEASLETHPAVRECVVLAREDRSGSGYLTAHVVSEQASGESWQLSESQVADWEDLYDSTYGRIADDVSPLRNFIGWQSSYTDSPIPTEEMCDWADGTAARIRELGCREILEIGCGTGLILFRLAGECRRYWGTDLSAGALRYLERELPRLGPGAAEVKLFHCAADRLDRLGEMRFDGVVLNSVVQYFPGPDYLVSVLGAVMDLVKPGGSIFLGDIRHLALLPLFHASVERRKAAPSLSLKQLRYRIDQRVARERELLLDPAFFTVMQSVLPRIAHVEAMPKLGAFENELTMFRYDVRLYLDEPPPLAGDLVWHSWIDERFLIEDIRRLLEQKPEFLAIGDIPNARLTAEVEALQRISSDGKLSHVSDLDSALIRAEPAPFTLEELAALAEEMGYVAEPSWLGSGRGGRYSVVFKIASRSGVKAVYPVVRTGEPEEWRSFAGNPLRARYAATLGPMLQQYLRERLPEYMVPAQLHFLDEMPLTPNGKVDVRFLMESGSGDGLGTDYEAPRNAAEEMLVSIWTRILGVERLGIRDNFFELGGHSLLATRIVSRIRQSFGVDIPLQTVFEAPTVMGLAQRVGEARRDELGLTAPPIAPVPRQLRMPLSYAQQRLWFIDKLEPGSARYNMPAAVRIGGALNVAALRQSLQKILDRHEVLRTGFVEDDGEGWAVVEPECSIPFETRDLRGHPESERLARARSLAAEDASRPFDLTRAPLIRVSLLVLDEQDHVLVLNMHHIVSDGWSMEILVAEIGDWYGVFSNDSPDSDLPELPVQYADFAVWQRRWLQGEVLEKHLTYWRQRLGGVLPTLTLMSDRPRPSVQSYRGASRGLVLPRRTAAGVKSQCTDWNATLFMWLLSAFKVLLYRYSSQCDLIVGTPIANRNRVEIEPLIGFFVNTLALRSDLSGSPGFQELVERVRLVTLGAYEHQDLPFERLVEELQPKRDLSRSPLSQVVFALQNSGRSEPTAGPLTLESFGGGEQTAKFDLTLFAAERDGDLALHLNFNTDLYEPETAQRLLDHFRNLITGFAENGRTDIARAPLLSEEERRSLLAGLADRQPAYPRDRSVNGVFEERAARFPDAVALQGNSPNTWGFALTYERFDRGATALAQRLRSRGAGPERPVCLLLPRAIDLVTAQLAVLKTGGCYVPLDPGSPADRIASILSETRAPLMVTDREPEPGMGGTEVLRPDPEPAQPSGTRFEAPSGPEPLPSQAAYIMYTSGSTGRPKGVCVPHRAILRLVINNNFAALSAGDVMVHAAPAAFDAATFEIWGALLNGAKLVLLSEPFPEPALLASVVERQRVTTLWLSAGLFGQMIEDHGPSLKGLRQLLAGGDVLPPAQVARALDLLEKGRLINGYGPTENTVFTACHSVSAHEAQAAIPIGSTIGNTRVHVLDPLLNPVPIGVAGELLAGGDGLSRGYAGQPGLTAACFLPDPFSPSPGDRMYRTGDLVRLKPSKVIDFLGRLDRQVKVRGFRIEPGEIEVRLGRHPAVEAALVTVRDHPTGGKALVAYVRSAAKEDYRALVESWRTYLAERLPAYMVPAFFVRLDRFPLTANGKPDRKGLPEPEWNLNLGHGAGPRNETERVLASIFASLLGLEKVGIHDSFFEIGGHSLLATRAVSRIRASLSEAVSLRDFFTTPTVAGLGRAIDGFHDRKRAERIRPCGQDGPFPLSFAQQRLWFLDRLEPGNAAYNIPAAVRLAGPLHIPAMERALDAIVRRHESLRTHFNEIDGKPVQIIAPPSDFTLEVVDLSRLIANDRESCLRILPALDAGRPFDLERGPLLRLSLLRVAIDAHGFLVNMHHIVSDGWSSGIFIRELEAGYRAFATGRSSPLPALPLQYRDFAVWQRDWLRGEALHSQLAYWRRRLAPPLPVLEIPTDWPRPEQQKFRGNACSFALDAAQSALVKKLCKTLHATPFMVLLSAFQVLLSRYSGQTDIIVGTPIANRNREEIEHLIGFFVNTLALRGDLSGKPGFAELVTQVREHALTAFLNQDLPFEKLVDEIQPARDLGRSPVFQAMFALQNNEGGGKGMPRVEARPLSSGPLPAKFELTLNMTESETGFFGSLNYNLDLFEPATAERMLCHFQNLLHNLATNPERPIDRASLMDGAELNGLWSEFNRARRPLQHGPPIHALIELQAERTPAKTALVADRTRLSFGELNEWANRLAWRLRSRGCGPEVAVAVYAERSPEMVVSLLAVWKTGAAYIPLDPEHPKERTRFVLEDAGPALCLVPEPLVHELGSVTLPLLHPERFREEAPVPDHPAGGAAGGPEHMAYIIYTSGSTGRPKGVVCSHGAVGNRLHWMRAEFPASSDDRVLQKTPFGFDVSVWEIFWPLTGGAQLVLAKSQGHRDNRYLLELAIRRGITALHFVPSMLAAFLEELDLERLVTLKRVFCSGEELPASTVARFHRRIGARLYNLYGPTEAAIEVSCHPCVPSGRVRVAIGVPIDNVRLYVLDGTMQPVPPGIPGQLFIGGAAAARGYHRRPDLTAASFVPDPFALPGQPNRLYKSGDRVRLLAGRDTGPGPLEFLGRVDFQVKIRGLRIEPGEIEAVLREIESVSAAVVVLREDRRGIRQLVAYVTGKRLDTNVLRARLAQRLPAYMVPSHILLLDRLPVTSSGKVDRSALPVPESGSVPSGSQHVAPKTPMAKTMATIWREVLGLDRVGTRDNFFELGGDSILSLQIVAKARLAGLFITPKLLFEHQTIDALIPHVGKAATVYAEQGPVLGELPLTPIQKWFLDQEWEEPHHFNQALMFALPGDLHPPALAEAVAALLEHHDILRLRLRRNNRDWQAWLPAPNRALPFAIYDFSGLSTAESLAAIQATASGLQTGLDLERGPMIRVALFRLAKAYRLFTVMHHLVVDGVSWRIWLEDLQTAYDQRIENRPVRLAPKTTSFRAWAYRLRAFAASAELEAERAFWRWPEGRTPAKVPVDNPRAANTPDKTATLSVVLDPGRTFALLQKVPRVYNTRINDVLLTALATALSRRTRNPHVLIDLEGHGREPLFEDLDLSRTMGWFTALYPLHLTVEPESGPGANLMAVKERLRAIPRNGVGYGILRYLAGQIEDRTEPSSEIVFNYLGQTGSVLRKDGMLEPASESVGPTRSPSAKRAHLLEINAMVAGGALKMSWIYNRETHRRTTVDGLARDVLSALESLISHCLEPGAGGRTPSDFPLAALNAETLERIAPDPRDLEDVYPLSPMQQGMLFHSIFEPDEKIYHVQFGCNLSGEFNPEAFRRAWEAAVARHTVLRTRFHWDGLRAPLQTVLKAVSLPWREEDWRDLARSEQRQKLDAYLEWDRKQGFALERAPLFRAALFRMDDHGYRFLWSHHHLLLDGWSTARLFSELFSLYRSFSEGTVPSLPQPRPYRDFIAWLAKRDATESERFWRRYLSGFREATAFDLAEMGGKPPSGRSHGEHRRFLPKTTTEKLNELARRERVTLNSMVMGAWSLLLARYSGKRDLVFGVTVSGRPSDLPGSESMIGLFINTLPFRVRIRRDERLFPWLRALQANQIEMEPFAHAPLVSIRDWSELPASQGLFESLIIFENYPSRGGKTQGGTEGPVMDGVLAYDRTNYPLTIVAAPGARLLLRVGYRSERLSSQSAARLAGHLAAILEGFATRSEEHPERFDLLTEAERHCLVTDWNDTEAEVFPGFTHVMFRAMTERVPEATAAVFSFDGAGLSYRMLDQSANCVAARLRALGVGPEVRVGLCARRSLHMLAGLLGILKSGGVYVPLDPFFPAARLKLMVEDAGIRVLVADTHAATSLPSNTAAEILVLETGSLSHRLVPWVRPDLHPENAAYVMYTSGSTGRPKGVCIPHRALANFLCATARRPGLGPRDVLLAVTTVAFDIAGLELYLPLIVGARIVVADQDATMDGERLAALIARDGVTAMQATPATWRLLLEAGWRPKKGFKPLCGGEALPEPLAIRLSESQPDLWNLYGPTETTIWSTLLRVKPTAIDGRGVVSIGRPLHNTETYILDHGAAPLPIGVSGQLFIAGLGLARGYLHQPGPTSERFVPNPFGPGPGRVMYATGDRARYRSDGAIAFLGRDDDQVKLRGFRIELGEIEAVMEAHPQIRQAAATIRISESGQKRIAAFLVASGKDLPFGFRSFLSERLPAHMLPSEFSFLDALPLTPNGKVDRKSLAQTGPEPEPRAGTGPVAPHDPDEGLLLSLWAEVLDRPGLGIHDHFFESGGHSLLAAQMIARVRELFRTPLPIRSVFEHPTVAAFARTLRRFRFEGPETPPFEPHPQGEAPPLSFAQQRLWFLARMNPGAADYNSPMAERLLSPLAAELLERAFEEILRRHQVLSSRFHEREGKPLLCFAPHPERNLAVIDLSCLEDRIRGELSSALAAREAVHGFDLAAEPLYRFGLLRLAPEDHLFLANLHHIVTDAWSMDILRTETALLYEAFLKNGPSPLPEPTFQYADFANWQRKWLHGAALESQLAFWRETLQGAPPLLKLPTDLPRSDAPPGARGARVAFKVPDRVAVELRKLASTRDSTPFMILLAAYQILLSRYSGQDDICVGTPVAGRHFAVLEPLIGCFVNTLVLRAGLQGNPRLTAFMDRVRDGALQAFAHQDIPFEKLVEELQPERSTHHSPLFQVTLTYGEASGGGRGIHRRERARETPLLFGRSVDAGIHMAKFELSLFVSNDPEGLRAAFVFRKDLFEQATVNGLARHLTGLLGQITANPDARIASLDLMDEAERHRILTEWNDTAGSIPAAPIHQYFELQARRIPDAPAYAKGGIQITYGGLNAWANHLAKKLIWLGVKPDQPVGLLLERGEWAAPSSLAILKAGGAYAPFDPAFPPERMASMLRDLGIAAFVTRNPLLDRLPAFELGFLQVVDLDEIQPENQEDALDPVNRNGSDHLAYVMYTSGSTGKPKGVAVPHDAVMRLLFATDFADFGQRPMVLSAAPPSFDAATFEIWGSLLHGGCCIALEEAVPSPQGIRSAIRDHGLDTAWLTAALFNQMVDEDVTCFTGIRQVLAGGEALSLPHILKFRDAHPKVRLINGYGPTESTTFACCFPIPADLSSRGSVPIGPPIGNTRVILSDGGGRPVAQGIPGELHIGGRGLARGYFGSPGLTAERFIPAIHPTLPGERLYKTGDLARWRKESILDFMGRVDHQVKLRGFRIEPGEIEALLRELAAVRDSLVILSTAQPTNPALCAYVVCAENERVPEEDLRGHLQAKLPEYMVPAFFVFLDAMPLTANGKIDRKALPEPGREREPVQDSRAMARDPIEAELAVLWAEILGLARVGREDDFFELGGHSLLATRLMARAQRAFGLQLPLSLVFENPSPATLARKIRALAAGITESGKAAIDPCPRDAQGELLFPLSFAQQRLWFIDRMAPGDPLYNVPMAERFPGPLSAKALERAFNQTIRRHESLRTRFVTRDGAPYQWIQAHEPRTLPLIDLTFASSAEAAAIARVLAETEANRRFDLTAGPLVFFHLFRLAPEHHVLLFNLHHIVTDGWSNGILRREVAAYYGAATQGRHSPLPKLKVQYADYASWQRQWLSGETLKKQLSFWEGQLGGRCPALDLPLDFPRPAMPGTPGGTCSTRLSPEASASLKDLSRQNGGTPFMTLLAGYLVLLHRYSLQNDICTGITVAGRTQLETEDLIGFFVNTLVLRHDLSGNPRFISLLERVRKTAVDAFAHQDFPFEKLVETLRPERDPSRTPLFQTMFTFLGDELGLDGPTDEARPRSALAGTGFTFERSVAPFELSCTVVDRSDGFQLLLEYRTDLFRAETIRAMAVVWTGLLESLAAAPELGIGDHRLGEGPSPAFLHRSGYRDTEITANRNVRQFIEARARRAPDSIAVVSGATTLSYAGLLRRADRLAAHLAVLGAQPARPVGLCLHRCPDLIAAILAIHRVGAAYMPMEPGFPDARLRLMLADSGTSMVLTQRELQVRDGFSAVRTMAVEEVSGSARSPRTVLLTQAHPAYIIYTSGSSGTPKGTAIPHGALAAFITGIGEILQITAGDRLLQFASPAFDASVEEIFTALTSGSVLCLRNEESLAPRVLLEQAATWRLTVLDLPTAMWHALCPLLAKVETGVPACLRLTLIGGEAAQPDALAQWRASVGDKVRLLNTYGPTEATVSATWLDLTGGAETGSANIGIGHPVLPTKALVVDARLRPLPLGLPGELVLGGPTLAWGYSNRAALSARGFVPDPLSRVPGGRWYRSGDLARTRADGTLEFLGRLDAQIKIRGFRIEPGEIEARLREHPELAQAAAVAAQDGNGQIRLVAYVSLKPACRASSEELRHWLSERLPAFLIPAVIVILDQFPLSSSGKIDRNALTGSTPPALATRPVLRAPRGTVRAMLAAAWQDLLGIDRVGDDDHFFAQGGHSLLAVRLVHRIADTIGVQLPLSLIFEKPRFDSLAIALERNLNAPVHAGIPTLTPRPNSTAPPLSFSQQRLWFLHRLDPDSPAYNVPTVERLHGPLSLAAWERVFHELFRRHEILRTRYPLRGSDPVQEILPPEGPALAMTDLMSLEPETRRATARQISNLGALHAFDLASEVPVLVHMIRLDAAEHLILLNIHHIATDGWSSSLLRQEAALIYGAFARQRPVSLPEPKYQYADFAVWQRGWLGGTVLDTELNFWRKKLKGADKKLQLPGANPSAETGYEGAHYRSSLDPDLAQGLRRLAVARTGTPFILLLAAYQVLLGRLGEQDDFCVGLPVSGRILPETDQLIGFFVNTLVVRAELAGNPSFEAYLDHVRGSVLEAQAHQHLPFEKLVESLAPDRDAERSPFFQVVFNYFDESTAPTPVNPEEGEPNLLAGPGGFDFNIAKFDLSLSAIPDGNRISLLWTYRKGVFERDTIAGTAHAFEVLLRSVLADPGQRINRLAIRTAEEKREQRARAQLTRQKRRESFTRVESKPVKLGGERP